MKYKGRKEITMALRNPNGYGSVVKLSGKRRKPYIVRLTVGYDDRAYPIYETLGYYVKRVDAIQALHDYNKDPYDIDASKATFEELYELWNKETFPKLKPSMIASYKAAHSHCKEIQDVVYRSLRKSQMQSCIDNCKRGHATRSNIKMLLLQLDKYAFDHDIISKCYATNLEVGEKEKSMKHTIWTDAEVIDLWKHEGEPFVDETLFMLYTGCRVSEMLRIECKNVNLEERYLVGGLKTESGIDRTIPIHSKLVPIIERHLSDKRFLFQFEEEQNTDDFSAKYRKGWKEAMSRLSFKHLTHDCRHTVISKLDSAGANKVAVDRIVGHSSKSVGEQIYTHKTVKELQEAIEKLVYVPARS